MDMQTDWELTQKDLDYAFAIAVNMARKWPGMDEDELRSAAHMGAWKAAKTWDPSRGAKYITHLRWSVMGQCAMDFKMHVRGPYAKRQCRTGEEISLSSLSNTSQNERACINDPRYPARLIEKLSCDGTERSVVFADLVQKATADLDDRDRDIVFEYFFRGSLLSEIGRKYKFSRERARQLIARCVKKMRRAVLIEYLEATAGGEGV